MKTEKKVPFRQTRSFGCGHHTLANLYNDDCFLGHVIEETGERLEDLNETLKLYTEDLFISPLFVTHFTLKAGNRLLDPSVFIWESDGTPEAERVEKNFSRPFFVTVYKEKSNMCHLLLVVYVMNSSLLYVVDSLKEFIEVMTPEEFIVSHWVLAVYDIDSKFSRTKKGEPGQLYYFFNQSLEHIF